MFDYMGERRVEEGVVGGEESYEEKTPDGIYTTLSTTVLGYYSTWDRNRH